MSAWHLRAAQVRGRQASAARPDCCRGIAIGAVVSSRPPKLHVGDAGVACALLGLDAEAPRADRGTHGQLLETFVFQELRRQASWHEDEVRFHHFREKDGAEVDIVLERGARHVAGVEVKASATVTAADFRGLRKLKDACGPRFVAGVVLYDGETTVGFGEGLHAVPIRTLWETK